MVPGSSEKEEIIISSCDEEQQPRFFTETVIPDEEYQTQIELMIERSLRYRGPALGSRRPHCR